jgi:hypothetical protein
VSKGDTRATLTQNSILIAIWTRLYDTSLALPPNNRRRSQQHIDLMQQRLDVGRLGRISRRRNPPPISDGMADYASLIRPVR